MTARKRLADALASQYRIERELGAGGMATVYLAEDLKHKRRVAVKVLKPELAAVLGAERFVQEITTTASLQHPHILPLFDSGEAGGFLYYVMPYIQGETIREKLNRETQFGIDEALKITTEVADALDYAHQNGVIHRDIKPENILLHNGRPMVMDFGIALALSAAAGGRMTETGLSLGTPHYMSPEQATADKTITARSDVYSLASVLYEMLAGEPPHSGGSAQAIIMKIIAERAQPVTELRRSVPSSVAAALAKALEKVPADRFASAREFADALGNSGFTVAGVAGSVTGSLTGRSRMMHWTVGAGVGVLATAAVFLLLRADPPVPDVVQFEMTLPEHIRLDTQGDEDAPFAISPDGKRIVFATRDSQRVSRLHIREIGQLTSTPLPGTENAIAPFFSPDGLWVGYTTDVYQLRKVAVGGGAPITLATDVQGSVASGSWGDDGYIIYTSDDFRAQRVRVTGGEPEVLRAASGVLWLWPFVLPGSKAALLTRCGASCGNHDLVLLDLETKAVKVLVPGAARGWYLPSGQLLYATTEGAILAVPFDAASGELRGTATPVLDGIQRGTLNGFRFAVSPSGAVMYLRGNQANGSQVVEVDRAGRERVVIPARAQYNSPRWSPTRDRIAVTKMVNQATQVMIYDTGSQTLDQLTSEGVNQRPSWSPDGLRVAFYTFGRDSVYDLNWMPADRSRTSERIVDGDDTRNASTVSWTRDGAWILFDGIATDDARSDEDLFVVGTGSDRKRVTLLDTPADEQAGVVSPNGRWLAYVSNEAGGYRVYVRPFMREGGRWLISTGAATPPLWTSDTEVVYPDDASGMMISARLELGETVRVIDRTPLFGTRPYLNGGGSPSYDVSRDGQRFLMVRRWVDEAASPAVIVLHWAQEMKRRMPEQGGRAP